MSWIDDGDYFGPDRRSGGSLRLFERRRRNTAAPAPSLGVLLRKLQFWAADAATGRADAVERYRARVQTVAKLARERGEGGVEAWLNALDQQLASALVRHDSRIAELSEAHLQRALSVLG